MPKKTDKKSSEKPLAAGMPAPAEPALKNEKPVPAKAAKKAGKPAAAPKPAAKKPRAAKSKSSNGASAKQARPAEPSDDAIRLRAYFIAEWRHRESVPGNSDSDWIEAVRQLRNEERAEEN